MPYIIGTCNFIRMLVWLERNNLMEKCQENDQRLSKQWGTLQLICKIVCGGQILFALAWLFVWSNPWIMKNKCHHQCWAEVQLTWFLYNTFAIIYPSHIIPNSKGLFHWFLTQLQEPPSILTCDPSLLLHVGTTVSLDPIATPLQSLDQSVPREFSWWGQVMHRASSWMDPRPKVSEKI